MDFWFDRICPSVRLAGSASHPVGWVEPRRVIYDHELVLFEAGTFSVEIEGERFDCPPGSWIVVPPMRWHATRLRGPSGRRRWVHFSWEPDLRPAPVPFMTYEPGRPVAANARPAPSWAPAGILRGAVPSPRRVAQAMTQCGAGDLCPEPIPVEGGVFFFEVVSREPGDGSLFGVMRDRMARSLASETADSVWDEWLEANLDAMDPRPAVPFDAGEGDEEPVEDEEEAED